MSDKTNQRGDQPEKVWQDGPEFEKWMAPAPPLEDTEWASERLVDVAKIELALGVTMCNAWQKQAGCELEIESSY